MLANMQHGILRVRHTQMSATVHMDAALCDSNLATGNATWTAALD